MCAAINHKLLIGRLFGDLVRSSRTRVNQKRKASYVATGAKRPKRNFQEIGYALDRRHGQKVGQVSELHEWRCGSVSGGHPGVTPVLDTDTTVTNERRESDSDGASMD